MKYHNNMKYHVGDKVRIINHRGMFWSSDGLMDEWMGKVMTIKEIINIGYRMIEDSNQNGGHGWLWCEMDIAELVERAGDKKDEKKEDDIVNHPKHYDNGNMECIEEMRLVFGARAVEIFCKLNAWKYRYRASFKNGQEDLDKANWYINKLKELKGDEFYD